MKMQKVLSVILCITLALVSCSSAFVNALSVDEAVAKADLTLDFADYQMGVVLNQDSATLENVTLDGKNAVKCVPNPKCTVTNVIKLEGFKYDTANIDLDLYKWVGVEYKYVSSTPTSTKMQLHIKKNGDIFSGTEFANGLASSLENITAGDWNIAYFDYSGIGSILNPSMSSHIVKQMHIQPFAGTSPTKLSADEAFYIGRLLFFKEKPEGVEASDTTPSTPSTPSTPTTPSAPSAPTQATDIEIAADSIVLNFAEYQSGIVLKHDSATLENVTEDGKSAVKLVPNPKCTVTNVLKIDGYSYSKAAINLDLYKWIAIEYKYVSAEPLNAKMRVDIKTNGGILATGKEQSGIFESTSDIVSGKWSNAIFNLKALADILNPDTADHTLRQMHLLPFSTMNLSKMNADDTLYISRIIFAKENPAPPADCTVSLIEDHPDVTGEAVINTVKYGSKFTLPESPFKSDAAVFMGWASNLDNYVTVYEVGSEITVESDFTFKALYKTAGENTDSILLDFTEYQNGIVLNHDSAVLETVYEDGRNALKCVPNPTGKLTTLLKIEGGKYLGAHISLDEYKWAAVEYKYISDSPRTVKMRLDIKTTGGILADGMNQKGLASSTEDLSSGHWDTAIFDLAFMEEFLNKATYDHEIRQMHVLPFGPENIANLKSNDVIYISKLMFFKEKPEIGTHNAYMKGYSDGSFKPDKTISRAEACTVVSRILEAEDKIAGTASFTDVATDAWYAKYIGFCEEKGMLKSYSGEFFPDIAITRAEFAELVYNTGLAKATDKTVSFSDVAVSHPKYEAIKAAASAGLIGGYADGTFLPDRTITRAQVVTVINRALSRSGESISTDLSRLFTDTDKSHWAFAEIAEATASHSFFGEKWLYVVSNPQDELIDKIGIDAAFDLAAGNTKVAELDKLEAETVAKIRASKSDLSKVTGTVFYVSPDGNDENDGKSEATPFKTVTKTYTLLGEGDAVLLKRGGLWREKFKAYPGVTYSAYGEGAKPVIYGSPENGTGAANWTLDFEDAASGAKIWKYSNESMTDVGEIIFNNGESYAAKEIPSYIDGKFTVRGSTVTAFDYKVELDRNLEFFHRADSVIQGSGTPNATAVGPLYLRCDKGNPGELYSSIEFNTRGNIINVGGDGVTIDNLCIMYGGSHGIGSGTVKQLTVRNCEIGFIGGSVQNYSNQNRATRFGNGVEIYGGCDGYLIEDCYVYQCYDAGITHQYDASAVGDCIMDNVTYRNNLITDCVYSIEYFLTAGSGNSIRSGKNILFEGNLLRRAGFGFGSTRPNGNSQRHIRSQATKNQFENYVIRNNIFDRSVYELFEVCTSYESCKPKMEGNTYIQGVGNRLFSFGLATGVAAMTDLASVDKIKDVLGDESAKVYFVEEIPYYEFSFGK